MRLCCGFAGAGVTITGQPDGDFWTTSPQCTDLSDSSRVALSGDAESCYYLCTARHCMHACCVTNCMQPCYHDAAAHAAQCLLGVMASAVEASALPCADMYSCGCHWLLSSCRSCCCHTPPPGTTLAGSTTLIDHASCLGLDMNNDGCRADLAFLDAYTITPGTFFGYTCTPVTA